MAKAKMHSLNQDEESKVFQGKIPPHSKEMEIGVIGTLIMDNRLIDELIAILHPKHFYSQHNSMIYKAIIELKDRNEPVDLLSLSEELKVRTEYEAIGGAVYLSQVTEYIGSKESVVHWANTIVEHWIRRELIYLTYFLTDKSYDISNHTQSLLDTAQQKIFEVTSYFQKKNYTSIQDEVKETMEYVETIHERHEKGATVFGVPSGYDELDALTGGFQKSELIIIAGRPSHGKQL